MAKFNDRCFCCFTAAMLVPLGRALTWRLHTKLHKFRWNSFPNNAGMKNRTDLNLSEVVCLSIIYHIPDSKPPIHFKIPSVAKILWSVVFYNLSGRPLKSAAALSWKVLLIIGTKRPSKWVANTAKNLVHPARSRKIWLNFTIFT